MFWYDTKNRREFLTFYNSYHENHKTCELRFGNIRI
jgi:hypothetical protein